MPLEGIHVEQVGYLGRRLSAVIASDLSRPFTKEGFHRGELLLVNGQVQIFSRVTGMVTIIRMTNMGQDVKRECTLSLFLIN